MKKFIFIIYLRLYLNYIHNKKIHDIHNILFLKDISLSFDKINILYKTLYICTRYRKKE